jgi:glutamate synthase (NADPH/NADH)
VGDHGCEYMTGGRVVILRTIGRNFAAAMSGGIAYVYNGDGNVARLMNVATIDIDEPTNEDSEWMKELITEFVKETESVVGQQLLENWDMERKKFVKIFPKDYKRVLREQAEAEEEKENADKLTDGSNNLQIIQHRRRKFSKSVRPVDYAGFEATVDLQEAFAENEADEVDAVSDESPSDDDMENDNGHSKGKSMDIENIVAAIKSSEEELDKTRGFVKYHRQKIIYRPAEQRLQDWDEVTDYQTVRSNLREQAARCMDCGIPFCQGNTGCPLGNIIPKWNDYVFKKNWRQALEQLLQTNNFPEFTGRVCPAPCEGACCVGISSPPVTIKSIECAIIDYAFLQNWITPQKPPSRTGKRIAVIGSGPAGLAAAAQLNKVGHAVVVYERKNRVGGLLRYGIPQMKLDKFVLDRRIKLMEEEGVKFITNTEIGQHVPADLLLRENDAIVITTGSTTPRDIKIQNREAKGICFAMDFLEKSQRRRAGDDVPWEGLDPAGKRIVVLGGGDTATDCIGTALRLNAKSINAFEILPMPSEMRKPENPWPQWPLIYRMDYGHVEAKARDGKDPRTYAISTKEFIVAENDSGVKVLTGLKTVRVEWEKDENGAWKMSEVPDSEEIHPADLCILAMGFVGPEKAIIEQLKLAMDPRSNIKTPNEKFNTNAAKVFAAGDCRRGQSLVVWAIHEGRQAARQVDHFLMGKTTLAGPGGIVMAPMN